MTLVQIISGGQTGVDVAALRAARAVGLQTGGWMPRGFRTLAGPQPGYAAVYGVREHRDSTYPPRTSANVAGSGATLRLAVDFDSQGERCTYQKIVKHRKPHLDIIIAMQGQPRVPAYHAVAQRDDVEKVARWLAAGAWTTVNIAGNSETTAPGIEAFAERFLVDAFRLVVSGRVAHLTNEWNWR